MNNYLKREKFFTGVFLAIVSFSIARTMRHGWIDLCGGVCPVSLAPYQATYAPEAYRIGVPALTRWLNIALHFKDATISLALVDFVSVFSALIIFSYFAVEAPTSFAGNRYKRLLKLAMFLAFIQFPIGYVYFHQRPETLPATFFIAFALFCLSRARRSPLWMLLLFAETATQAFMRADVPFIFGVATILLSLFPGILSGFGSRSATLIRGFGVTLIAGGIQAYLAFIRFPDKHYGPEHAVVLHLNLNATSLSLLLLSILPFALIAALVILHHIRLSSAEALILTASTIYVPVWFTVGLVAEVRIFVPFLLALCVVAARVSVAYLLPDDTPAMDHADSPNPA